MDHFIPLDGDLYNTLSTWATQKKSVRIQYTCNGVTEECEGLIRAIFREEGIDLLLLSDGTVIRLDRIESVNRMPVTYNC